VTSWQHEYGERRAAKTRRNQLAVVARPPDAPRLSRIGAAQLQPPVEPLPDLIDQDHGLLLSEQGIRFITRRPRRLP